MAGKSAKSKGYRKYYGKKNHEWTEQEKKIAKYGAIVLVVLLLAAIIIPRVVDNIGVMMQSDTSLNDVPEATYDAMVATNEKTALFLVRNAYPYLKARGGAILLIASIAGVTIGQSGNMYNMFVMRKKAFKAYCSWLFPILEELEYRVDSSDYSDFQKRYVGRVSELLFNVWLVYNTHTYSVVEAPVVYLGKRDVLGKAVNFLKAKFLGKKYERSM